MVAFAGKPMIVAVVPVNVPEPLVPEGTVSQVWLTVPEVATPKLNCVAPEPAVAKF